jgi:hypothetical protein
MGYNGRALARVARKYMRLKYLRTLEERCSNALVRAHMRKLADCAYAQNVIVAQRLQIRLDTAVARN